jgi:hydrogenase maturation factor
MCFSIPYKVLKITKNTVFLEGGKTVRIGREWKVKEGEYLRIIGNLAVGALTKSEGLKIRQLIKKINEAPLRGAKADKI